MGSKGKSLTLVKRVRDIAYFPGEHEIIMFYPSQSCLEIFSSLVCWNWSCYLSYPGLTDSESLEVHNELKS
tara:strand:- start:380 stop:592 length:213 start_codon:yes stop_codon:yes gene_type:complete